MRRLLGIVAIAFASCVLPADTEAQDCAGGLGTTVRDRGTDTCVAKANAVADQLAELRALIGQGGGALDPRVDSLMAEIEGHLSGHPGAGVSQAQWDAHQIEFGQLRDRVAAESARMGIVEARLTDVERLLDSLVTVLPDTTEVPPPAEDSVPEEPPPHPPDTTAPPDTAALVAPDSMRTVSEAGEWWAAWTPVSGAEDHVVSWLGRDSVTTKGPNETGEIWMMLGAVGTLEGEDVCAAGRLNGVAGPETCRTISDVEPPPDDGGGGGGGTNPARPGTGWSPQGTLLCDEDFTRFSDWAAFMSGAQCISNKNRLDGWGRLNIDVDQNGLWYRYREDPTRCGDQIVGQANIPLPAGTREVWMEFTTQFSANFDTRNPGCSRPAPDFKYVLVWVPGGNNGVPCGNGRAEIKMGTNGGQIAASIPGFSQCDDVKVNPDGSTMTVRQNGADQYFDGQPHTYRVSFRALGGDDWHVFVSIDGVTTHDYITNSINAVDFDRIMMGSNRNLGAVEDMFLHWQSMKVWAR